MNYKKLNTKRLLSLYRSKKKQLLKYISGYSNDDGNLLWKNDENDFSMAKKEHDDPQKELNQIKEELNKRENI